MFRFSGTVWVSPLIKCNNDRTNMRQCCRSSIRTTALLHHRTPPRLQLQLLVLLPLPTNRPKPSSRMRLPTLLPPLHHLPPLESPNHKSTSPELRRQTQHLRLRSFTHRNRHNIPGTVLSPPKHMGPDSRRATQQKSVRESVSAKHCKANLHTASTVQCIQSPYRSPHSTVSPPFNGDSEIDSYGRSLVPTTETGTCGCAAVYRLGQ